MPFLHDYEQQDSHFTLSHFFLMKDEADREARPQTGDRRTSVHAETAAWPCGYVPAQHV